MNNWNRIGKIKALFIVVFDLMSLITPIVVNLNQGIVVSVAMPLFFGSIIIPSIIKFNHTLFDFELAEPNWNDSSLIRKKPLVRLQFNAFLFLAVGLGISIGTAVRFQFLSQIGLFAIFFGIGILIGVNLTLKWVKIKK